jgi:uncharacterized protein
MSADAWYLDSSALVKTIREEPESRALVTWLLGKERLVACELVRVEVVRAARRSDQASAQRAREALSTLGMIPVDRTLYEAAADLGPPLLRTLDALHLAAALLVGASLVAVVTYDARMADAARVLGLAVEAPA